MKNLYSLLLVSFLILQISDISCREFLSSNNIKDELTGNPNSEIKYFYLVRSELEYENLENTIDISTASIYNVDQSNNTLQLNLISNSGNDLIIIKSYTSLPQGAFIALMDENEIVKQIVHKPQMQYTSQFYLGIILNKAVVSKVAL